MSSELSTGRTIFILAVVVGCFAVLWPKVFYPMLTASMKQSGTVQAPYWRDPANAHHLTQLCFLLEEQRDHVTEFSRWSDQDCLDHIKKSCGISLTERILENFRLSLDKTNMTECLRQRYDITVQKVLATAPPPARVKAHLPQSGGHHHARPERPLLHHDALHPALREKGRTMPQRTIEKQARPGPMPGVRPPMGGGGHMAPPQSKGSGAMGIIMPLYTVGIVIFFVYTIMKVLFKKQADEDCKAPKLKDFHLDPEYRKYVFAEEYLDSSNASHRRQEREASKQRRRQDSSSQPDTKIEDSHLGLHSSTRVDSKGKPLEDEQMDQLRRRLEETERAMERLMSQMGSVTDKLTAAKITEVLSQAQAQARILKEAAEGASDDDFTTSEAFTNTLSDDFSLPLALQRHLEELKVKDIYLKGTSAGIFAPPPISPDEVASLSDRDASEQGQKAVDSTPLPATNDFPLNSRQKLSDAVHADQNSSDNEIEDELPFDEPIENRRPSILKVNLPPVVDFPIQVASNLKENAKEEKDKKQKDEVFLSSDIALHDKAEENSDKEGSSDETETGADISELKSFADDGASLPSANVIPLPVVEEQAIPEATYATEESIGECNDNMVIEKPNQEAISKPIEIITQKCVGVEHGTQTDTSNTNQQLSVLNLRTTYQIDKTEQNKGLNIKEIEDKVNEIVLDANLPMYTQLLVKEAQTGSSVSSNIEIDGTDIGDEPCVITSQVSLAFVGMEQNEHKGPLMLIVPEKRSKDTKPDLVDNKLAGNETEVGSAITDVCVSLHEGSEGSTTIEDSIKNKISGFEKEKVSPNKEILPKSILHDVINKNELKGDSVTPIHLMSDTVPTVLQKTMSVESVELTPELLQGNIKFEMNRDIIGESIVRPPSPVPPFIPNKASEETVETQTQNLSFPVSTINDSSEMSEIKADNLFLASPGIYTLANTIVSQTTLEALERVSKLPLNEWNDIKNQKLESFDFQDDYHQLQNNNFASSYISHSATEPIKSTKQPGEVGGSGKVECSGEESPINMATVRCFSTVSPPGSPQFGSDPPFRSEDTILIDSSTQLESVTSPVQGSSLVADDSCKREDSASQQSHSESLDSIRNQEAASKLSSKDGEEVEMNHKG